MRLSVLVLICGSFCGSAFAKVSINPPTATLLPNQCFVFDAHFSEASDQVRRLEFDSEQPLLRVFAKSDCSGGQSITISGALRGYSFSVLPDGAIGGGTYTVGLQVTSGKEEKNAKAKVVIR